MPPAAGAAGSRRGGNSGWRQRQTPPAGAFSMECVHWAAACSAPTARSADCSSSAAAARKQYPGAGFLPA